MNFLVGVFVFLFGAIVGSFLNVVILRYNTGVSFWHGRSFCPSCGKKLSWYELVPMVSFLALRGKCAGCGSKISIQYLLVELATGLLFLATSYKLQATSSFDFYYLLSAIYYFTVWSISVVIFVYDLRHKIIPDGLVFLFAGLSLAHLVLTTGFGKFFQAPYFWDILAGPLLALPFAALWFFSRGRWMGFGDAKLALGIGWFLGLIKGASAIIIGFWVGAVAGLLLIGLGKISAIQKRLSGFGMKSEIPFGPFLILGTAIAFFINSTAFDLVSKLF